MSKLLKGVAIVVGVLVGILLVLGLVVYIGSNGRLSRRYAIQPQPVSIPTSADAIERGHHLAVTRGCLDCHGADLGGNVVIQNPAMGTLAGPNLTRGHGSVTAQYGDIDWVRSIREGVNPNGRPLVLMPSMEYASMTDADVAAIIAYAKSVPPVDRDSVKISVGPVARALILAGKFPLAAEHIDHQATHAATIAAEPSKEYGRYLAVGCIGCHNPSYSGGKIDVGPPDWPPAANLTPDPSTHLSKWSEADFVQTIRTGRRPDGTQLSTVMPRNFGQMTDTELKALYAFLKSLPPRTTGQR